MARVSGSEVQDIIDTDLETLTPFIDAASQLVDGISGLGAATLKEIERWLAAHFVAIRDQRTAKDSVGDSSHTYGGKTGMGLDFTSYGQMAKALDTTGYLATVGIHGKKPSLTYLGGVVDETTGNVEV